MNLYYMHGRGKTGRVNDFDVQKKILDFLYFCAMSSNVPMSQHLDNITLSAKDAWPPNDGNEAKRQVSSTLQILKKKGKVIRDTGQSERGFWSISPNLLWVNRKRRKDVIGLTIKDDGPTHKCIDGIYYSIDSNTLDPNMWGGL